MPLEVPIVLEKAIKHRILRSWFQYPLNFPVLNDAKTKSFGKATRESNVNIWLKSYFHLGFSNMTQCIWVTLYKLENYPLGESRKNCDILEE